MINTEFMQCDNYKWSSSDNTPFCFSIKNLFDIKLFTRKDNSTILKICLYNNGSIIKELSDNEIEDLSKKLKKFPLLKKVFVNHRSNHTLFIRNRMNVLSSDYEILTKKIIKAMEEAKSIMEAEEENKKTKVAAVKDFQNSIRNEFATCLNGVQFDKRLILLLSI